MSLGEADNDLLHWSHWWYLESARLLDLRAHVQGPPAADGRTVVLTAPLAPSRLVVRERVVPKLLAMLETERSDDILSSALVAVGRLADVKSDQAEVARGALEGFLTHSQAKVRESAILGLGLLATPEAVRSLDAVVSANARGQQLMGTTSVASRFRAFAAHALGLASLRIDDMAERQRIAIRLVEVLDGETHGRDDLPVAAVGSLGLIDLGRRASVPPSDLRRRETVNHVLSNRTLARYLRGWVLESRSDERTRSTRTRAHAAVALARRAAGADPDARGDMLDVLSDLSGDRKTHVHVRTAAIIGLGELGRAGDAPADQAARRRLGKVLKDGQPLERRFALMATAWSASRAGAGDAPMEGWSDARRTLQQALSRARSNDLAWSALALGLLEDRVHDAGVDSDVAAAKALSVMGSKRRGDNDSAALGLALALASRGTDGADRAGKRILKELDETSTPQMRGHLSIALGLLEHADAKEVLRAELEAAKNQPIRLWSAAVALALMGESVDAELVKVLGETKSAQVRISVAAALGQTGTARAVDPLMAMMAEDDRPTPMRASMVDAIAAICDLSRLPWRDPIAHAMPYYVATPTLNGSGSGILERPW